jgi:hypothetical protein
MAEDAVLLGLGVLGWSRYERITDRYGSVCLFQDSRNTLLPHNCQTIAGTRGTLRAAVLEARQSSHVGDWARGLRPQTPAVGEVIVLGSGTAFVEEGDCGLQVGLRPDSGREVDWLSPKAMYRLHDQTVRLEFQPSAAPVQLPARPAGSVRGLRRIPLRAVLVRCPDHWGEFCCWRHSRGYRNLYRRNPDVCIWEVVYVRDSSVRCRIAH